MLTVDDFGRIRRAHRDGMSIREISRTFHHSRKTIRKALRSDGGEPEPYRTRESQPAPKLGPFHETILQILQEDEQAPPKQRHTVTRIFERLCDEQGYTGSYSTVRRFHRETSPTATRNLHPARSPTGPTHRGGLRPNPGRLSAGPPEGECVDPGLVVFECSVRHRTADTTH